MVGEKAICGASLSSSFVLLAVALLAVDVPAAFCCNSPPESKIRLWKLNVFNIYVQKFKKNCALVLKFPSDDQIQIHLS